MARPKLTEESNRKIKISISLTREQIQLLKDLGDGNISQAIRELTKNLDKKQ